MQIAISVIMFMCLGLSPGETSDEKNYLELGIAAHKSGKYDSAQYFLEQSLLNIDQESEPEKWVAAMNWLGWSYMDLAKYIKADSILKASIEYGKVKLGSNDLDVAFAYHILAKSYGSQTKWNLSNACESEALRIRKLKLGESHPELAKSYEMFAFNTRQQGLYDSTIQFYEKALDVLVTAVGLEDLTTARIYAGLAWVYGAKGELKKTLDYNNLALRIRKEKLEPDHPLTLSTLSMNCWCYNSFGNHHRALTCYEEVLEKRRQALGNEHPLIANAYQNIGYSSAQLGDYEKSIYYYNQGIKLIENKYGSNKALLVRFYGFLAASYQSNQDTVKFLEFVNKAITVGQKSLGHDHPELVQAYRLLASYYHQMGERDQEYIYLVKALQVANSKFGSKHSFVASIYSLFGDYYSAIGNEKKALESHHKSVEIFQEVFGNKHPQVGAQLSKLGFEFHHSNNYDSALFYFQRALYSVTDTLPDDIYLNPELHDINSAYASIGIFMNKGRTLMTRVKSDEHVSRDLIAAVENFNISIQLIDSLRNTFTTDGAKQQLYEDASSVYDLSIDALRRLYNTTGDPTYLNEAFKVSERSRAFILLNTINNHLASKFSRVPDSTISKERDLKVELAYFRRNLFKHKKSLDTARTNRIKDEIFIRQLAYDRLVQQIESLYPDYYTLKYDKEIVEPKYISNQLLTSRQAILEFFFTNDRIHVFSLTSKGINWYDNPLPREATMLIHQFRKSISDYNYIMNNSENADKSYVSSAYELYKLLLNEVIEDLPEDIDQLIIVTDDLLGQINLEALLTEKVSSSDIQYANLPYLMKKFQVSYAYSISFLAKNRVLARNEATLPFGGFAPIYESPQTRNIGNHWTISLTNHRSTLTGALEEVTRIAEIMSGDLWLGEEATEGNFKKFAGEYQTLHLAMHGILDDKNPLYSELLFTETPDSIDNGKLDLSEIYNLELNANLVVLSACNTGSGKIQQGEGNMSMSRAFAYAGCPSVIMSKWKIPDEVTSDIMVRLYENLNDKSPKDIALNSAKLEYLMQTEDPILGHPYFWAGFVLMGDAHPIPRTNQGIPWIPVIPAFSLIIAIVSFRKISGNKLFM